VEEIWKKNKLANLGVNQSFTESMIKESMIKESMIKDKRVKVGLHPEEKEQQKVLKVQIHVLIKRGSRIIKRCH
jgi:DUF2075 family protein